jgi:large subunit ribosomal protein L17
MMKNMVRSLIEHERIKTTEAKAKELQILADKLVTVSKTDTLHARRQAYVLLGSHHSVQKLFQEIAPRFKDISGGYTRVVKFSLPRPGDGAPMALIEFSVDSITENNPEKPEKSEE